VRLQLLSSGGGWPFPPTYLGAAAALSLDEEHGLVCLNSPIQASRPPQP